MGTQITSDMGIPVWDAENTDPASDDKTGAKTECFAKSCLLL